MSKADDIYHAFPKSVDGYATKFGQWSTKLGADGKPYQWLKMPGSYGGKRVSLNIPKMRINLLITDFLMFLKYLVMKSISTYLNFLQKKGRPLSEINPGSDETALAVNDALQALDLLEHNQMTILGGDILSEENNELAYAYQVWGDEYQYLNWYCDRVDNESKDDYAKRSYVLARESIANANATAEKLKKKCYIVFVIK